MSIASSYFLLVCFLLFFTFYGLDFVIRDYWVNRWESSDTSFDQDIPHRYILKFYNAFVKNKSDLVFFPLCGKSIDMLWVMKEGNEVLGVELSDIPIRKFFSENSLTFDTLKRNKKTAYVSDRCQIIHGDIFELDA